MNKNILGLLFVLPFFLSININGQESTNTDVEEVVVTGSNIQRSGYTAISVSYTHLTLPTKRIV